jgi:hypothetical protein
MNSVGRVASVENLTRGCQHQQLTPPIARYTTPHDTNTHPHLPPVAERARPTLPLPLPLSRPSPSSPSLPSPPSLASSFSSNDPLFARLTFLLAVAPRSTCAMFFIFCAKLCFCSVALG